MHTTTRMTLSSHYPQQLLTVGGLVAAVVLSSASGCRPGPSMSPDAAGETDVAPPDGDQPDASGVDPFRGGKAVSAISYSGYREGQSPKQPGTCPSKEQIEQDLRLLVPHWNFIRLYSVGEHAVRVLSVIRETGIELKVMLGAWLSGGPRTSGINEYQISEVIKLANAYDDIVVAVSVGNEVLVDWSDHRFDDVNTVIKYVRRVRKAVSVPVTVADNYVPWSSEAGKALAPEVDFATIHTYPQWEHQTIEDALSYTIQNYEAVRRAIPNIPIVIGEAGWATRSNSHQHMVVGQANECNQTRYINELTHWCKENDTTCFLFEAFDEPWKGSDEEAEPEKHWGLFDKNRVAKHVLYERYPDRRPPEQDRVSCP